MNHDRAELPNPPVVVIFEGRFQRKERQMSTAKNWMLSSVAAVLSVGVGLQPHPVPFWQSNTVIAAEEAAPTTEADEASSSATKSAKMDEASGTQSGATQSTPPESKTK